MRWGKTLIGRINAMPLNEQTDKIKRSLYKQQEIHAFIFSWDTNDTNNNTYPFTQTPYRFLLLLPKTIRPVFIFPDAMLVLGHEDRGRDEYGNLGPGGSLQPFFVLSQ
jgi:hypothetical protein